MKTKVTKEQKQAIARQYLTMLGFNEIRFVGADVLAKNFIATTQDVFAEARKHYAPR